MSKFLWALVIALFCSAYLPAQVATTQSLTELQVGAGEYEIGGVKVTGSSNLDQRVITLIAGLQIGDKITFPGDKTTKAIKNLWRQKLFDDIGIFITEIKGDLVFLEIRLTELPKLSKYGIRGLQKSKQADLREELDLSSGVIVTENLIVLTRNRARNFFVLKGYLNTTVDIVTFPDTSKSNSVIMEINVNRGPKVKIEDINYFGVENIKISKLNRTMKKTKNTSFVNLFRSSKLDKQEFKNDQRSIISKYNALGYRDARIVRDTVYAVSPDRINVDLYIEEGRKYYFRNITWLGNTKYSTEKLNSVLRINKGDVYDADYLQERLFADPTGGDVSSVYLDNGYLFFDLNPVEVLVENDSIDLEMRIREGRQATIKNVTVVGNDRTNDHVVMRELRTKPGELFRRSDIQRSMRELQQLGFFEPTELNVNPMPNAETGTVDIEYSVVERSTSQLELQGGWGANNLVGTLGLNFNNFSVNNMFKEGAWRPLPAGDGQTVNLRAQSTGRFYQSYSISFTEPWLGGKKPNSLTLSFYHNVQNRNGRDKDDPAAEILKITGFTVGLGKRLRWPDDYFTLYQAVDVQRYKMTNYPLADINFKEGFVNNFAYKVTFGRNNTVSPIYPRNGSLFNISGELTLPYSIFSDRNFEEETPQEKYEFLEYYKWKVNSSWFTEIVDKLVLKTSGEFGFLGAYNKNLGLPPFERFELGGDGLQNFVLDGREIIGMRGYPNSSLRPSNSVSDIGGSIYNKFTLELRYLITENPNAQIFTLAFLEGGNTFTDFDNYQPFELKRSAGMGVRIFMPMFGILGIDFGYGFDPRPGFSTPSKWNTHFIIGQQF